MAVAAGGRTSPPTMTSSGMHAGRSKTPRSRGATEAANAQDALCTGKECVRRCEPHCHLCVLRFGLQLRCVRCKNRRYLFAGACHDACDAFPGTRPVGTGNYFRRCLALHVTIPPEGLQALEDHRTSPAPPVKSDPPCALACDDCVRRTCKCHNGTTTGVCGMCKNQKYLYYGHCHGSCSAFAGTNGVGTGRFNRRCVPTGLLHRVPWRLTAETVAAASITIDVGDTVEWVFSDAHNIVSGEDGKEDHQFVSGALGANSPFRHTFERAGRYPYFCGSHKAIMKAVITVLPHGTAQQPHREPSAQTGTRSAPPASRKHAQCAHPCLVLSCNLFW